MYFTAEQAAEYDEKKAKAPQFVQSFIVINESDAIEWLKDRYGNKHRNTMALCRISALLPSPFARATPCRNCRISSTKNFIQEPDRSLAHTRPERSQRREALRTKVLLKEFNGYVTVISQPKAKKLRIVRVESLRAGFKNCWEQKDFKTIVSLGDMIPQNILLEDEQLLMYYDIAKDRV